MLIVGIWVFVFFATLISNHALAQTRLAPDFSGALLAQADGAAVPAAPGEDMNFIERLFASGMILPIGLLILFYAIFLAPERRRKAEEAKMLAGIKKNDRVVTVGGIHATVANVSGESDIVTLKIDESTGTKIRVNRSAIARVMVEASPGPSKDVTEDNTP